MFYIRTPTPTPEIRVDGVDKRNTEIVWINGKRAKHFDSGCRNVYKAPGIDVVVKIGHQGYTEIDMWENRIRIEDRHMFAPLLSWCENAEKTWVSQPFYRFVNPLPSDLRLGKIVLKIAARYNVDDLWINPHRWLNCGLTLPLRSPIIYDYGMGEDDDYETEEND